MQVQAGAQNERIKLINVLNNTARRLHYAQLDASIGGKNLFTNPSFVALTCILDENLLAKGEPGSGKTTLAKTMLAILTGVPYDLYNAVEIRGHAQLFDEKVTGRLNYGKLQNGVEEVVWQGTFGLPAVVWDEANRTPAETQAVILQWLEDGTVKYANETLIVPKRAVFLTANHHDDGNGELIPPLNDRLSIMIEQLQLNPVRIPQLKAAQKARNAELCSREETIKAMQILNKDGLAAFRNDAERIARARVAKYSLISPTEMLNMRAAIESMQMDNDAMLFLQSVMAEINFSVRYGQKRLCDPISDDSHDKMFAGIHTHGSFSPRPAMAAEAYAKGIAWLLGDSSVRREHVNFVLPFTFAHKVNFTDDFKNDQANQTRTKCEELHLAEKLVEKAFVTYGASILPMKNFVALIQHAATHGLEEFTRLIAEVSAHRMTAGDAIERLTKYLPPVTDNNGRVVEYTQQDVRLLTQVMGTEQDAQAAKDQNDHPLLKYLIEDVRDELKGGMK